MRSFRERSPVIVGVVSLMLLATAVGLAFSVNRFSFIKGVYIVHADLEDAAGVRSGNEVRLAGVKIGQVTGVRLTPRAARIKMEIAGDISLPRETKLEVKLKTLLGQKFIDLQMPRSLIAAQGEGEPPDPQGGGFLQDNDVIPLEHTSIPFDIYQAATEGTAVLEEVDKKALRKLLGVLAGTFGRSGDELRRAIAGIDDVGAVLGPRGTEIARLLRNLDDVSATLAASSTDLDVLLARSAEVLTVLAEERATTSSLLAAANDLGSDLGTLIALARGDLTLGFRDLNSLLAGAEAELDHLEAALAELAVAQELFAAPGGIGRFVEGSVCAVTSEDTCVPHGSPETPGLPVHGIQPSPSPAPAKGLMR